MKIIIHRGTHEIGGTIIELQSGVTRILLDAGYPLFLDGKPIDDKVSKLALSIQSHFDRFFMKFIEFL